MNVSERPRPLKGPNGRLFQRFMVNNRLKTEICIIIILYLLSLLSHFPNREPPKVDVACPGRRPSYSHYVRYFGEPLRYAKSNR